MGCLMNIPCDNYYTKLITTEMQSQMKASTASKRVLQIQVKFSYLCTLYICLTIYLWRMMRERKARQEWREEREKIFLSLSSFLCTKCTKKYIQGILRHPFRISFMNFLFFSVSVLCKSRLLKLFISFTSSVIFF